MWRRGKVQRAFRVEGQGFRRGENSKLGARMNWASTLVPRSLGALVPVFAMAALMVAAPFAGKAQTPQAVSPATDDAAKNAAQARAVLDAMVKALGGDAWLNMQNQEREGHYAVFYHGNPDLGTTKFYEFHSWPDHDRTEFTTHRDVVQFFIGRQGWEITYRGKKPLPADQVEEYLRRRDHSIETAVKVWMKDPNTILIYEGQQLAERHLADQVTLISSQNEAITILVDAQSHLPLRRAFQWRDPTYHDKNTDAEEYDGYRAVNGFPTPYTITRFKNDEMTRQIFIDKVSFNESLPPDIWNVDNVEHRIKK
jgi:hypothetical protein